MLDSLRSRSTSPGPAFRRPDPRAVARRTIVLGLSAAALAGAVSACGGDDSDDSPRLSRSEYVRQADTVCTRVNPPQGKPTEKVQDQVPQLQQSIRYRKGRLAELEKLNPPEEIGSRVDAYLDANRKLIDLLEDQVIAARAGDLFKFQDIGLDQSLVQAQRNKTAAEIGFKECGQPTAGPPTTTADFADEELVSEADRACTDANEVIVSSKPEDTSPRNLAEAVEKTLPAQRKALETVKGLRPAEDDRKLWEEFVSVLEERTRNTERLVELGKAGDEKAYEKLSEEDAAAYAREQDLARRLGLEVCGQASALGM